MAFEICRLHNHSASIAKLPPTIVRKRPATAASNVENDDSTPPPTFHTIVLTSSSPPSTVTSTSPNVTKPLVTLSLVDVTAQPPLSQINTTDAMCLSAIFPPPSVFNSPSLSPLPLPPIASIVLKPSSPSDITRKEFVASSSPHPNMVFTAFTSAALLPTSASSSPVVLPSSTCSLTFFSAVPPPMNSANVTKIIGTTTSDVAAVAKYNDNCTTTTSAFSFVGPPITTASASLSDIASPLDATATSAFSSSALFENNNDSMVSQNENEKIICRVCAKKFIEHKYSEHIQTDEHKTELQNCYKDRIDFETNQILATSFNLTMTIFFDTIKNDFMILIDHIILLKGAQSLLDVKMVTLLHDNNITNKNIAELKYFYVMNKELSKNTNVSELYESIMNSFIFQYDTLNSESRWSLEEIISLDLNINNIVKHEIDESNINILYSHINDTSDNHLNKIDNIRRVEPIQLLWCKLCNIYTFKNKYQQHRETTGHKISNYYHNCDKSILISKVQCNNRILRSRIFLPKNIFHRDSIDEFFCLVESDLLELFYHIIKLQYDKPIKVKVEMYILYKYNNYSSSHENKLEKVEKLSVENEIISQITNFVIWIQQISNKLKLKNRNFLMSEPSYYLSSLIFIDIHFYEM